MIEKDFMQAHWLLAMIESTTGPLYLASKHIIKTLGLASTYLWLRNAWSRYVLVVDSLTSDVFQGKKFIDEHVLPILPEERKATAHSRMSLQAKSA